MWIRIGTMSDVDDLATSSFTNISEPSASQPSIIEHDDALNGNNEEDLDDLPSPSETDSDDVTISEEEGSDAEREWKESMQQFELLMSLVLIPYVGKYFGRKFAYWGEYHRHATLVTVH